MCANEVPCVQLKITESTFNLICSFLTETVALAVNTLAVCCVQFYLSSCLIAVMIVQCCSVAEWAVKCVASGVNCL